MVGMSCLVTIKGSRSSLFFFPYPRAVCRISFSRAQKATETTLGMDEREDADLSFFVSSIYK
jgi:hypothetical protein